MFKIYCTRFISFWLYFIVCLVIFAVLFLMPRTFKSDEIKVDSEFPEFDSSEKPFWIAHVSDTHIAAHYKESIQRLKDSYKKIHEIIKPTFAIHSGDIVDNYETSTLPTYSRQTESQWKIYAGIVEESGISKDELIEILGNHDIYDMVTYDKGEELFDKYSKTERDDFYAFTKRNGDVRVVGFLAQELPTSHGPAAFISQMTKTLLDHLEEAFDKEKDAKYTILVNHFINALIFPSSAKSSRGNTYHDIIRNNKVDVLLAGHSHPAEFESVHLAGTIEISITAMKEKDGFGLLTYDNGRINYAAIDQSKDSFAVVTSPAQSKLATRNFKDTSFPIRVISFDSSKTKSFHVTGDAECDLVFKEYLDTDEKIALYESPDKVEFSSGIHKIHFSGDIEEQDIEFAVNCNSGPFKEKQTVDLNYESGIVGFVLIYVLLLIMVVFMFFNCFTIIEKTAKYICGESKEGSMLVAVLCGPAVIGNILYSLPLIEKIVIVALTVWPLCLPIMLYRTEGKISMLWLWGYVVDGTQRYDCFSMVIGAFYLIGVLGMTIYAGTLIIQWSKSGWSYFYIIDICCMVVALAVTCYILWLYVADIGYKSYWGGSFTFIIFPIIVIIMYVVDIIIRRSNLSIKSEIKEEGASDDTNVSVMP